MKTRQNRKTYRFSIRFWLFFFVYIVIYVRLSHRSLTMGKAKKSIILKLTLYMCGVDTTKTAARAKTTAPSMTKQKQLKNRRQNTKVKNPARNFH